MSQMLRGGVFWDVQKDTRCASHGGSTPDNWSSYLGFRIAKHKEWPRALRGGSWGFVATLCRAADRPGYRYYDLGFRISRRKI